MHDSSSQHFATLPREQLAPALWERLHCFYDYISGSGYLSLWQASFRAHHGRDEDGSHVAATPQRKGSHGQFTKVKVNVLGNLTAHYLTLTTADRPTLQAVPTNTDLKSFSQAQLGTALLDHFMSEKRLEDKLRQATQISLLTGLAWVSVSWDATRGEVYEVDPNTGAKIHEGDLTYRVLSPLDVAFNPNAASADELDYVITRDRTNRWDLIAKYPEFRDQILHASSPAEFQKRLELKASVIPADDDTVTVWTFQHRKTEAVQDGRFAIFLDGETILQEGPLPYRRLTVFPISPAPIPDQVIGHSMVHDLLGLQKSLDALASSIISNQKTFGVQNVLVPKGHNISAKQLSSGLNMIEHTPGKEPKPLNLVATPAEIFQFVNRLEDYMQSLSGINSVIRGQPDASLKSGAALALVQTEAQRFASGLRAQYQQLLEQVGLATIHILIDYAKTERVAVISGKNNRSQLKLFTGQDLQGVNRVRVQSINSLARTPAGRMQMADNLLQAQLISPAEYFEVLSSGTIEAKVEKEQSKTFLVRDVKDRLLDGATYTPMLIDDHPLMVKELSSILDAPSNRENPELVQRVLSLISQHMTLWRSAPADVLAVMGIPPPPPLPGVATATAAPAQGQTSSTPTPTNGVGDVMGADGQPQEPKQPQLPTLPDGEPWAGSQG